MNRLFTKFAFVVSCTALTVIGASTWNKDQTEAITSNARTKRPNIVLLIADDLGYADLAMYGGEVPTPNIDSLAKSGVMFTNFHVAPTCSPSRSMLISGVDNHLNGLGNMGELLSDQQKGQPGYEGYLNNRVVPIPEILKDNGYHTYMVGKWHLGAKPGSRPSERGFEQSFALMQGGGNHFNMTGELANETSKFVDNGQEVTSLPPNYYAARYYTDKMIDYINKDRNSGKPFFIYASYQNVHAPLQVPDEYIKKYLGKYDMGWDKVREQRFNRQKQLGLIPQNLELPPRWPMVPAWDSLSPEEKRYNSKVMAIYSGMLNALDDNIGRLIKHLKDIGEYDNTVFIFISDNGGSGLDFVNTTNGKLSPSELYKEWFEKIGIDNSYENLGRGNSYVSLGLNWSQVSNTPLLWSKARHSEGGTRVPAFISYPRGGVQSGKRTDAFAHELNIVPTVLNYAGINPPKNTYQGRTVIPPQGRSLRAFLEGKATRVYSPNEPFAQEVFGTNNKSLKLGDWKILKLNPPWGDNTWKLYNLREDPRELNDLSQNNPEQLNKMVALYDQYAKEKNIVPGDPAYGF